MRLYERFAEKNFHSSVATTFGIDFDAYESIALSRLRGAGCRNNIILADRRMLMHALNGASNLPQQAGTTYTISGAKHERLFHPKLFLQCGRKSGRLLIGSANLTPSGLAGNVEIAASFTCADAESGEQQLIAQAWHFISGFIGPEQQSTAEQIAWMRARTPWLEEATPASGLVTLTDGRPAALLLSGERAGIAERFASLINEPVKRLIVVSPYWDPKLAALSYLTEQLNPARVAVLVDPQTREFPGHAAGDFDNLTLYSRGGFKDGRFVHAKVIVAQTEHADHVLFGSANCTNAALGGADFAGSNAEACLYRNLPAGHVVNALKLDDVMTDDRVILPDALQDFDHQDDLQLEALDKMSPGLFEGRADTLIWHMGTIASPEECTVTLLDAAGKAIETTLKPLSNAGKGMMRFEIGEIAKQPAFARISRSDGYRSIPTIINWIETLKLEMRERHRTSLQNQLDELEGDTEASLLLLEIMKEFETSSIQHDTSKAPISVPRSAADNKTDGTAYRVLSYEEFIKGRRPRTTSQDLSYNSLAGSDVSIIRGVLNRIIGLNKRTTEAKESGPTSDWLDLGDETEDGEGALANGAEFGAAPSGENDADEQRQIRRAKKRRATQKQLAEKVKEFQDELKTKVDEKAPLTNHDLLRLRALLMILATAASPYAKLSKSDKANSSQVRVLPVEGEQNSWPMLMGRLLFSMFGGNNPAVKLLHVANEHDQIPEDFSECWATCYWALQACMHAPLSTKEKKRVESYLKPLTKIAFLLTLPSKTELGGDDIIGVMKRLSDTYCEALSIDAKAVLQGHQVCVGEL